MKKILGYRVYKVLTDNSGKVVHKTPIGFAKTQSGARALKSGCSGLMPIMIEEVYSKY